MQPRQPFARLPRVDALKHLLAPVAGLVAVLVVAGVCGDARSDTDLTDALTPDEVVAAGPLPSDR